MLLAIISAILLILAFPNFNLSFLVFIGFVPLFFAIRNKPPKKVFWLSYLCGFLFYLGTLYWLYHVTVFGLIILSLYLALYFGIFGFFINRLTFYISHFTLLFIPFIWIVLEWLQSHLFGGFGWALLGYSQYKNLYLIQIADFSGVYGVSFIVMVLNVAIYKLFRRSGRALLVIILVLAMVFGYGRKRMNEEETGESVRVSVIQGNIPQELKWNPDAAENNLNQYVNLTRQAAFESPDLIIWPETSFPGYFASDKKMTEEVFGLAKKISIPLLIGANTEDVLDIFNSAVLISKRGEVVDRYDKIHLVPFGEYVPFSDKLPILHRLVLGEFGAFTAGKEFKVFKLSKAKPWTADNVQGLALDSRFGVLICFEDIFPRMSKKFVQNGAQFLIVITNDAWYGRSGAPFQHAACSVFRAIENRVPIVRSANTGYSCFIDSRGRIYDSVEEDGSHLFISGQKTSNLTLR
ncbi:MAG: apolipoprotein N-acyltransferase [Candidatus Omnitrophica bacterium]|nr:apolipoprotein N-acyltransferase [Candidatus Omnitrophota bacterium]MBU4589822.1 apolipoprotein N-acyltransferase [Candidatus Omnitrophota bacterium]